MAKSVRIIPESGSIEFIDGSSIMSMVIGPGGSSILTKTGNPITGTVIGDTSDSYATQTYVTTAVSNLVAAAPGTLDTLNELAAALGDDPNFATTVTNSIATKLPLAGGTLSGNLITSGASNYILIGGSATNNAYNAVATTAGLMFGGGDDPYNYSVGTSMQNVGGNYTKLNIKWHTGIRTFAMPNYGGIRCYSDAAMSNEIFSIGNLDNNVRASGNIYASGGDSTQWNTSYGWGNHASAGYLTSYTDTNTTYTAGSGITLTGTSFSLTTAITNNNQLTNGAGYQLASTAITTSNIGSQSVSYATTAGSAPNGGNSNTFYNVTAGNGYGVRFWASDSYKISMGASSLYYYGPVTDYSIKTQMDDGSPGRGFTWGRQGYAPIASINSTSGFMQIAGTFVAGGDIVAFSDSRVKENIETIDNALDKVLALRGVTYNRTDLKDTSKKIGVIAQEVQKIIPEVVQEQGDGMLGVSYGNIVGVLIEAIKEQQKQIDELKALLK